MSKKKVIIFLSCLAAAASASAANLLVNGDFEDAAKTGWTIWWGNDSIGEGNANRYVTDPVEGDHCAGVWWHDDGIWQDVFIGPGVYEFGGKLMTTEGMVNRRGVIRAEIGDAYGYWWTQDLEIVPGDATHTWFVAKAPAAFPNWATIDNTTAGATRVRIQLMMANTDEGNPAGVVYYDDVYFGPQGIRRQAKFPNPKNGQVGVAAITDILRWQDGEPNDLADTMLKDVYLGTSPESLSQIAHDVTVESLALSELVPPISLLPDTQYYWRVDCTDPHGDPNTGGPRTAIGDVWTFTTTSDNPPVVEAGNNQYLYINMADGDGDPAKVTFTLNGVIGDDGKSPVTSQWSLIYSEQDPATSVTINNPAAAVTSVTINGTGFFRFLLVADDAFGHAEDTVEVIVYGSACEAAYGDPADLPTKYPNGHGDVNGDCLTNLEDLALLAGSWLDCMSARLGCTP